MTILQEILKWSQGLPAWQSDALSRLLSKQTLTTDDLNDLYAMLKSSHGIPDPAGRTPKPLSADQIPAPVPGSTHVVLVDMKNLCNVNAIAEKKKLEFGPTGLTAIYGGNGTGKSGYSRVLKRGCRARDNAESILPNANLKPGVCGVAKASFDILIDGTPKEVHWIDGAAAPAELSAISIFDSRCARAYLDSEDDFSYVPYGLDVFESLAKTCNHLKGMIDNELGQYQVDMMTFAPLEGSTAVGKMIASLSSKTSPASVEALASLTEEELSKHAELEKSLRESNPKEKADQLRMSARRIAAIEKNTTSKGTIVNSEAVNKLRGMQEAYRTSQAAAAIAAKDFIEAEKLLPGTGGDAWRELFEAARRFAIEAYPGKTFPELGEGEGCPLCQQPLADGAARFLRFDAFLKQATAATAQTRWQELDKESKLFAAQVPSLNLDEVAYSEVEALDSQLARNLRAFDEALKAKHKVIKEALSSGIWDSTGQELSTPAPALIALAERLNSLAKTLEDASDEKQRSALLQQFAELDARVRLRQVKETVLTTVSRLVHRVKLGNCLYDVKTKAISHKSAEIAEKVVSKELEEALNREFKALGAASLRVSLHSRADKGKALHKLKMELPQSCRPGEILSEGEQRAIAIGSFLAEVGLSAGKGAIVFDDPVSSLDHRRRERVATRLVAEAAKWQVIVFTHDIYFLCILMEEAETTGVPIKTQSMIQCSEGFGATDPELPFEGNNTAKRIGALKAHCQEIARLHKDGAEKEHRKQTIDAYQHLRMAWERAVEEVLLRRVVLRFRKGVETQRLAEVLVEDADYKTVDAAMTRCSNYAHDKAIIGGVAVPDPDELLADIQVLEDWRSAVETRSKAVAKKRKT